MVARSYHQADNLNYSEARKNMNFCTQCGNQMLPNSKFCTNCGSKGVVDPDLPHISAFSRSKIHESSQDEMTARSQYSPSSVSNSDKLTRLGYGQKNPLRRIPTSVLALLLLVAVIAIVVPFTLTDRNDGRISFPRGRNAEISEILASFSQVCDFAVEDIASPSLRNRGGEAYSCLVRVEDVGVVWLTESARQLAPLVQLDIVIVPDHIQRQEPCIGNQTNTFISSIRGDSWAIYVNGIDGIPESIDSRVDARAFRCFRSRS
jgi:hypothetical protein